MNRKLLLLKWWSYEPLSYYEWKWPMRGYNILWNAWELDFGKFSIFFWCEDK